MADDDMQLDPELEAMLAGGDSSQGAADGGDFGGGMTDDLGGGFDAPAAPQPVARATTTTQLTQSEAMNLGFLLDIKLDVTFEVGRAKMLISDLLTLGQGSVIELHRMVGEDLDLLVNGKLIAKGEVVVVNEKFACRINAVVPPEDRIKHMGNY